MARIELKRACIDYPVHRMHRGAKVNEAKQSLGGRIFVNHRREYVRALDRVDFNLVDGERIALLGSNGGGKSTLLKTLAGILPLAAGERTIEGRVATLFSTSPGVDPERTGEENIYRLAALYDLPRKDVPALIESVAEFTELGAYLRLPLKTYSNGMRARLGFAIVTGIPSDIVLIDEVIGVGDSAFYKKARERFGSFMQNSGATVIASHSNSLLNAFCRRGFVMNRGRIVFRGSLDDAVRFYKEQQDAQQAAAAAG